MASPQPLRYVLFTASFLMFLSSPTHANATASTLVESVCKEPLSMNLNYGECVKALWADARIKSALNLKDLGIATLELAKENANVTLASFNNLLHISNGGNTDVQLCGDLYGLVVKGFQVAIEELKKDHDVVNYILEMVQKYHDICLNAVAPPLGTHTFDGVLVPSSIRVPMLYRDIALAITSGPSGIFRYNGKLN